MKTTDQQTCIEVEADRIEKYYHTTYSADTIAESKTIRGTFPWQGNFYVVTGGIVQGDSVIQVTAYRIMPRDRFNGKADFYGEGEGTGYWADTRRAQPEGFYHGMLVNRGSRLWVLVGPPLVFTRKPGSAAFRQTSLF